MKTKAKVAGRIMPEAEREQLVEQIEAEKAFQASLGRELPESGALGAMSEANGLTVDRSKLNKRIGTLSKAVKDQAPEELRGAARNAAVNRHRYLEETLPDLLMTKRDQDVFPRDGHDYHVAVRKAKAEIGDPAIKSKVDEYRRLGRTLFPDDPDKSSIERLRKLR